MLPEELKERLHRYNREELLVLAEEIYKAIPEHVREERQIDSMVTDIIAFIGDNRLNTRETPMHISIVETHVDAVVVKLLNGYYTFRNYYVPKHEKHDWKYNVRGCMIKLQSFSPQSPDGRKANILLMKLYEALCLCISNAITLDPFRTIRVPQGEFFGLIVARTFASGITGEDLDRMFQLILENSLEVTHITHMDLIDILIEQLTTPDAKELGIDKSSEFINIIRADFVGSNRNKFRNHRDLIWVLLECGFKLYVKLRDPEGAIDFVHSNHKERNIKTMIPRLLVMLLSAREKELWLREYRKAMEAGIPLRRTLHKTYDFIVEHNYLPETEIVK